MFEVASVRAKTRLFLYFLAIIALLPFQYLMVKFLPRYWHVIPLFFHRLCLRILGIELRIHGTPVKSPATLYVSNHSSYLDITVLGAILPASFIAKAEIATWPIFSWLAILQRSVFIKRDRRQALEHKKIIEARLAQKDSLILFAEGTTSDGSRVLPFMSSLFDTAQNARLIQPISISFTELDGIPVGRTLRHIYAWYGDMTLAPHFFAVMHQGDMTIDVIFHDAINPADYANRKILSETCHNIVAKGVSDLIVGQDYMRPAKIIAEPVDEPAAAARVLS